MDPYIDSPKWLKNRKTTRNTKNNDDKHFQHPITAALNYEQIKNHPKGISKIKLFIEQYNLSEIDFPSNKKDSKIFDKNNESIAYNILYVPHNTEEISYAHKSKYDEKRENKVIFND